MMPIISGTTLVRRIRDNPVLSQIPVILLSARSGEDDSLEGLDAGATDYVVKPFSPRELLARVRVHIRLARMRRQTVEHALEIVRLQSQKDAKNSLLSLVSHNLRTPLSSIVQAIDLLKNGQVGKLDTRELYDTVISGAETLGVRIDQLLDVAVVDSSKFVLCRFLIILSSLRSSFVRLTDFLSKFQHPIHLLWTMSSLPLYQIMRQQRRRKG